METPTFDSLEIGLDSMLASVPEGEILLWKGMVSWTPELCDSVKPSNVKNGRKKNTRNCPGTQLILQT